MTNTIALCLGAGFAGLIAVDVALFGSANLVFLGQRLLELIEWMAFWR